MTRGRRRLFALTVIAVLVADQLTKALVRVSFAVGESRPVVDGVLWLTHVRNTGAAFGMLRGQQWLLVGIASVVLVVIGYVFVRLAPRSPLAVIALALVAGGAAGNLIDRAVLGAVTDFIDFGWFPVFNAADIALDVGVALLVWWLLFASEREQGDTPEGLAVEPADAGRTVAGHAEEASALDG